MANFNISKPIKSVFTEKLVQTQENVLATDVALPDDAPARMKILKAEKKKWYLTVVYLPDSSEPFALFCTTNHPDKEATTHDAVEKLLTLAENKGIMKEHIDKLKEKIRNVPNVEKLARSISLLLRHRVSVPSIVGVLDSVSNVIVGSFLFQIKKFLSSYIKDGQKADGKKCEACGSTHIVYMEGCHTCRDCGSSKCG